ncbi:MAG TPA: class I SAM-dependent methyltransferase [Ktedonobacterales bacterium]|nr:class I SAM-dependent methyltransferase [Ktedonobacterales bacterium]
MDSALQTLLAELEERGSKNDAVESEYRSRMMNLEPATARVLALWVRSARRQRVLEIGTSNGYSTIWLAWAVSTSGGQVTSVDRLAEKHELADANLRRAGLRERVELVSGDATGVIGGLPGPFDCIFFDADRFSAPAQLELLVSKLTPDVLLFADNALSHPQEIASYLAAVDALPEFEHTILPVGKGLSVAYRSGASPQ